MKNAKFIVMGAVIVAIAVGMGVLWRYNALHPSTDDAYIGANILTVSPQVTAQVTDVLIAENQRVSAGDVMVQLDQSTLSAAVQTAQAQLDQAVQAAGASGSNVQAAEGALASAEAQLTNAQASFERTDALFKDGDVSQASLDNARATRDSAQAARDSAQADLNAARQSLGETGDENAGVRAARGALEQAQIALSHATISAPIDGWIANLNLRPGDVVLPGQDLFSVVEDGRWWVDANFKETDIHRIRPGHPVSIAVDMYPGTELTGTVQSLGAGSGATFSLLPPQNATGNWVKVTQRFPVRIIIDTKPDDPALQLRVGASTTARVNTTVEPTTPPPATTAPSATPGGTTPAAPASDSETTNDGSTSNATTTGDAAAASGSSTATGDAAQPAATSSGTTGQ